MSRFKKEDTQEGIIVSKLTERLVQVALILAMVFAVYFVAERTVITIVRQSNTITNYETAINDFNKRAAEARQAQARPALRPRPPVPAAATPAPEAPEAKAADAK